MTGAPDIVDEAKKGGYSFSTVTIGEDISETPKQTIVVAPVLGQALLASSRQADLGTPHAKPRRTFATPEQTAAAKLYASKLIAKAGSRSGNSFQGQRRLQSEAVQRKLVEEVTREGLPAGSSPCIPAATRRTFVLVVRETTAVYVARTIAIPRVIVLPRG